MAKLESDYKAMLVKQARQAGAYARRLEDRYGVGVLDIVIIPPAGLVYFIEAKRIEHRSFGPTDRQYIEGLRIIKANGTARPLLVGWDEYGVLYIAPGWPKKTSKLNCWSGNTEFNYYETLLEFIENNVPPRNP